MGGYGRHGSQWVKMLFARLYPSTVNGSPSIVFAHLETHKLFEIRKLHYRDHFSFFNSLRELAPKPIPVEVCSIELCNSELGKFSSGTSTLCFFWYLDPLR